MNARHANELQLSEYCHQVVSLREVDFIFVYFCHFVFIGVIDGAQIARLGIFFIFFVQEHIGCQSWKYISCLPVASVLSPSLRLYGQIYYFVYNLGLSNVTG